VREREREREKEERKREREKFEKEAASGDLLSEPIVITLGSFLR